MLKDLKMAPNKTVGLKQTIKAIQTGKARRVYLAEDVDRHIMAKVKEQCSQHGVELVLVNSMSQLGEACGIQVGSATAAILD